MHCNPKPFGVLQTTIIKKPGLLLVHDYQRILGCIAISDWQIARPEMPIDQIEADYWDRIYFRLYHRNPVALYHDHTCDHPRLTLTGAGLLTCAVCLSDGAEFVVDQMVERILGKWSDSWKDAEDFLHTGVAYLAEQSGKLASTIPGDNSDKRGYLNPDYERNANPAFWNAFFGPVTQV